MSLFKIPRTSQPQGPVGIDWSNPITKDLAHFTTPTVFDDVGKRPDKVDSVKMIRKQTAHGKGYQRIGDNDDQFGRTGPDYYGTKFTVLSVVVPFNNNASSGYCLIFRNSGGNNTWTFTHDNSVYSTPTVRVHTQHYRVARQDFTNGNLTYSDTTTSLYSEMDSGLWICPTYASNVPYTQGVVTLVVAWTRILSAKEIASVSANPWQIFQPIDINPQFDLIKPKVYVPNTYFTKRSSMMLGTSVAKVEKTSISAISKRVTTKQPHVSSTIDWQNPITKDLVLCMLPGNPNNLASGKLLPIRSPVSFEKGPYGNALVGGFYGNDNSLEYFNVFEATVLFVSSSIVQQNGNTTFYFWTGSSGTSFAGGLWSGLQNGAHVSLQGADGPAFNDNQAPGWAATPRAVCVSKSSSRARFNIYMDGRSQVVDGVFTPQGLGAYPNWIVQGASVMKTYLCMYWNRVLEPSVLKSLSSNPWQLFKQPSQIIAVNN